MNKNKWKSELQKSFKDIFEVTDSQTVINVTSTQLVSFLKVIGDKWLLGETVSIKLKMGGRYSKTFEIRDTVRDIKFWQNEALIRCHDFTHEALVINEAVNVDSIEYSVGENIKNKPNSESRSDKKEVRIVTKLKNGKTYIILLTHWEKATGGV